MKDKIINVLTRKWGLCMCSENNPSVMKYLHTTQTKWTQDKQIKKSCSKIYLDSSIVDNIVEKLRVVQIKNTIHGKNVSI